MRAFGFGPGELLIIFAIVIVLFGPGRLGKALGELSGGLRAFKDGWEGKKKDDEQKIDKDDNVK